MYGLVLHIYQNRIIGGQRIAQMANVVMGFYGNQFGFVQTPNNQDRRKFDEDINVVSG